MTLQDRSCLLLSERESRIRAYSALVRIVLLGPVAVESSDLLMKRFYRLLMKPESRDALRAAQLELGKHLHLSFC